VLCRSSSKPPQDTAGSGDNTNTIITVVLFGMYFAMMSELPTTPPAGATRVVGRPRQQAADRQASDTEVTGVLITPAPAHIRGVL
jgi:hypothetical protein